MTGERPREDEDIELTRDDVVDDSGSTITPDRDTTATQEDLDTREAADSPQTAAPFPEPAASERMSGPRRTAVVSEKKARTIAAEDRKRAAAGAAAGTDGGPATGHGDDDTRHVDDRVSKLWVGLITGAFLLILLYGILGGRGGVLNPRPTAEPSPSPAPTLSAAPSPTTRPSVSPSAPASVSPSGSPGVSASPAASPPASPAASPSAAPATTVPSPS